MNGLHVLLTIIAIGCYVLASYSHKNHGESFLGALLGGLAACTMIVILVWLTNEATERKSIVNYPAEWVNQ